MTTQITTTNIQPAALAFIQGPVVSSIQITNSSYTVLDDTAVDTAGGYIKINGVNFVAGMNVVIGSVTATSVSVVSSTVLNVQVPAQSAGTYIVYVIAPDGGVSIVINGLTYSGTPTWVTGSTLTGGQVDEAISLQLDATGATSYALAAGSSLPAGLTLSSGGLLSGTVTGITVETLYNFTVNAIDNELQDSPRAFSITISANDQYFEYVTALLSASTPASTFVTDASTNAFNVTVFGDTRPSNFGPYTPGYYSNFFDGTGDYLTVPDNAAFEMTADFTVEAWFYPTSNATDYQTIVSKSASGIYAPYIFYYRGTLGTVQFSSSTDGATYNLANYTSLGSVTLNTWNHVAVSRSGSSVRLFLNGTLVTTITNSSALTDNNNAVGIGGRSDGTELLTGYISNVRIVKGTGLYTASFTPSNTPLTVVSGTSLLTCLNNRITDSSTNNFTITRNGDVTVNSFDPFLPSSSYSTYGSGYFDGTGDYLSIANTTALQFGTGDFTVEAWVYLTATPGVQYAQIIGRTEYGTNADWMFQITNSRTLTWYMQGSFVATSTGTIALNTWTNVAATRSGSSIRLFINGVIDGTATNSGSTELTGSGDYTIGADQAGDEANLTGYISNLRVVKGTAVYTSNFTPSTTPLTAIANTSLLTLQNNQPNNNNMFLDSSTNNFNITRNGNTTQGTFSPYGGGWSAYFDGDGDNLILAPNAGFSFGTGDFTVEFWVYYPPYSNVDGKMVLDSRPGSSNGPYWCFGANGSGVMTFTTMTSGGVTISDTVARTNQWVHYAATRSGTSLRLFANGTQVASATNSDNISSSDLRIGTNAFAGQAPTTQWVGYISNVRIVKGTAVYTSNFTPSTTPLTPIANTQLLTCADNRFIDDSPNNFAITRNGNTSIQRFNPFNPVTTTPTSYSGYFDGNGDYLTTPSNAALAFGSTDFCLEFWIYTTAFGSTDSRPLGNNNSWAANAWSLHSDHATANEKYTFWVNNYNSGSPMFTSTSSVALNTWTHVAITRSGNSWRMFINGTQEGSTVTSSAALDGGSSDDMYIGGSGAANEYVTGYMSNVRAVKGSAVYTANFTPSTTPLTAIANTSLLTLQSPTFIDNSTNNFTITNNGDTAPRQFNPFGWTNTTGSNAVYTTALYGGSAYFDGTGDWLTAPDSTAFDVPGDYTVELWFYPAVSGGLQRLFMIGDYRSTFNGLDLYVNGSNQLVFYSNGASIITGGSVVNFQWNHVALVRRGSSTNNTTLYLNGISVGQATNTTSFTGVAANGVSIGLEYSGAATSVTSATYISDARLSNGTARYTSNFQPPIAPLTALQNTVLLNNMTGAGIYDSSMMANYETVGNASISTSLKKYGNTSLYFDGTGDHLYAPWNPGLELGSGNFTIEFWAYISGGNTLFCWSTDWHYGMTFNYGGATGNRVGVWASSNGSSWNIFNADGGGNGISTGTITLNTWTHVALVRNGSTWTLYLNGTSAWTGTSSATIVTRSSDTFRIGGPWPNSGPTAFNGYLDDFRITNGIARYTTTFTPPTSPFIRF